MLLNVRNRSPKSRWTLSVSGRRDPSPLLLGIYSVGLQSNTLTSVPVLRGKDGVVVVVVGGGERVCNSVFEDFHQRSSHPHLRSCPESSELVMVLGEVLSVVGGLASHKHVPVFQDLLFGQHLVLQGRTKEMAR